MINYTTINLGIISAFVKRWYSKPSSFHIPHGEISITLDDVLCLLHLPIRGRLLDHSRITRYDALEMMVDYLGTDPYDALKEIKDT